MQALQYMSYYMNCGQVGPWSITLKNPQKNDCVESSLFFLLLCDRIWGYLGFPRKKMINAGKFNILPFKDFISTHRLLLGSILFICLFSPGDYA